MRKKSDTNQTKCAIMILVRMRGTCSMFQFFSELQNSVKNFDRLTSENKFMSNPFNKVLNQTFVWTEKSPVLKQPEIEQ